MNILLIEDDQFKQELVEKAIVGVRHNVTFQVGRSVQQAVRLIRSNAYDLIVLDMALPSHDSRPGGAQPISQPTGGIEVLLELSYEDRKDKVVIVTQYPEIEYDGKLFALDKVVKELVKNISANIVGVVYFTPDGEGWRSVLKGALQ